MENWLNTHKAQIYCVTSTAFILGFVAACPSTTSSLTNPQTKVTRGELQAELEGFLDRFELRLIELDRKDAIREALLTNATKIAKEGTVNPIGILTSLFAVYGAASATKDGANAIKNRRKPPPTA